MERRSLTVMRLSRYIKGSTYLQVSQAMMLRADILQAAPKHATEGRGNVAHRQLCRVRLWS